MKESEKHKEMNLEKKEKILSISNIKSIFAIMSTISLLSITLIDVSYRVSCSKYFGIPEKYFSYDFKTLFVKILLNLKGFIILFLFFSAFSYILIKKKKGEKEKKEEEKQRYSFKTIIEKIKITEPIDIIKTGILVLYKFFNICLLYLWLSVILYIVIEKMFGYSLNADYTTNILFIITIIGAGFLDYKQKLINNLFLIINFFAVLIIFYYAGFNSIQPEYKKSYEVTTMKIDGNDERVVVLSNSNDKCLVVKYDEKDGEAIFYTKKYYFINRENKEFSIKNFKNKSIDKKSDKNNVTKNLNNKSKM
ncbi:hypothetical protein [Parvimonas micra]|uniref:Uncharacterized protein n=1 Tax=Parvimonas micra TaxID=33033 RepID=A0A9X3KAI3_9FIRM|nr:hypothetical protein [Parvimonas micra]MCZ7407837.1 hypothetical protein [Parvimonas micra]MCZ7410469.1 hypothetical protein [Parvimonas micra]MCZ7412333.1 hypothetical protein [Parvimonas micra]WBB36595.1 hypothetical protein NM218_05955 [Parvimonas micra]